MAMLRSELIKAREYRDKVRKAAKPAEAKPGEAGKEAKTPEPPARDLRYETLSQVLDGKLRLLITADRVQDIQRALRLGKEFDIKIMLDSAAEAYLAIDESRQPACRS